MTKEDVLIQRPRGTKDYLDQEAQLIRGIESTVGKVFRLWGYSEVITPTFEYMEVLRQGTGPESDEMIFRFFDREGHTLGLRSDATTPIARLAATRFNETQKVLRLSYLTNIFRYVEPGMGREREFHQGGVELIGSSDPQADAEVIQLAAAVFEELGIEGYRLDLGEIGFSLGFLEDLGLSTKEQKQIHNALVSKDFVQIKEIVSSSGVSESSRNRLKELPLLRGGIEVLDMARDLTTNSSSQKALQRLSQVCSLLPERVLERVQVDLGMVKDLEYYTGVIFEGYVADMGYTVCTGGRYDSLIGRFGTDKPAVGFGFGLERLVELLQAKKEVGEAKPVYITYHESLYHEAQDLAAQLRAAGTRTVLSLNQDARAGQTTVHIQGRGEYRLSTTGKEEVVSSVEELIGLVNTM